MQSRRSSRLSEITAILDESLIARFRESPVASALRDRDLIFTVTSGRSGTMLLTRLLSEVLGVHAEHEPAPRANFALRVALGDPNAGLRWLADAKLPAIAALGADPYVETSHLYCKGLIEPLLALGVRPRFIILRRDAAAVAQSFYQMGSIPARTREGRLVMLDPSDAGTLPFPGWQAAGDYELCYWYALEMERRQAMYRERFRAEEIAFAELDVTELVAWDGFARLCAFVAPALDPAPRRARFDELVAVNQHPRDVALPGASDRSLPPDLAERRRFVERAVAHGAQPSDAGGADTEIATVRTRYGPLAYAREDDPCSRALDEYGEWAQLQLEFALGFLTPGATVVEAGANAGAHTIGFAHAVGPGGRVVAFEPRPAAFELLRRNVAELANVDARDLALGRTTIAPAATGAATICLDELALAPVDLIAIGAARCAGDVLRGAAATVARCRPFLFARCAGVASGIDVLAALADAHYAVFFHRAPAYNPDNVRGERSNRFGHARELGLWAVPLEREADVRAQLAATPELFRIETAEDLAAELVRAPRAGDRTEHDRDPAWLRRALERAAGEDAPGRGAENERTRISAEAALDPQAATVARLRYRLVKQAQELEELERAVEELRARAAQAGAPREDAP